MDDLNDYFERLDATETQAESGTQNAQVPTVPRFSSEDFARLQRVRPLSRGNRGGEDGTVFPDCAICLQPMGQGGGDLLQVPCSGQHRFHVRCLRGWLAKSVHCPVCRVDVKALLPPIRNQGVHGRRHPIAGLAEAGLSARTRDGGRILCYEAKPPPTWERPVYIPAHQRHIAQYLEIEYPGQGTARIWRVPRVAIEGTGSD